MNPIYDQLPPGPQRDEAEYEARMAEARATIERIVRERDEARYANASMEEQHARVVAEYEAFQARVPKWLIEGIERADARHPRSIIADIKRGDPHKRASALTGARQALLERTTWLAALECEVAEALFEYSRGEGAREDYVRELRDVAIVAFRWARDAEEGGAK